MHFRLVRPMQRKGSRNFQFQQRIPADVRERAAGLMLDVPIGEEVRAIKITPRMDAVRLSLRTTEPSQVKIRQAQVTAYLENVWRSLRQDAPVTLTPKQSTALAKAAYLGWAESRPGKMESAIELQPDGTWAAADPMDEDAAPAAWESAREALGNEDPHGRKPEEFLRPIVQRELRKLGIGAIDGASMERTTAAFQQAIDDALANRQRQAGGDYSPDPNAGRFPVWTPPTATNRGETAEVSLAGLVEGWWKEAQPAGRSISTYESYKSTMDRFAEFLKHDNGTRVTPANVVAFKDFRLAQGVSAKTVGDSDIAALRVLFGWAVDNQKLTQNPARGVKVVRSKPTRTRGKEFTPEEASAILGRSLRYASKGRENLKLAAAKRWVPWLCAYSGARVGEIVQLRKEDIREVASVGSKGESAWVVTITPEAGTVKDKEVREVVLHDHLIAQGFLAFITSAPHGYLFLNPRKKDGEVRGVWKGVKNRLREFIREVVKDERVQPNHAWRHTFKTIGREVGIADSILDAVCGHAAKTVGGAYGSVTLKAQSEAMRKFPRFEVEATGKPEDGGQRDNQTGGRQ